MFSGASQWYISEMHGQLLFGDQTDHFPPDEKDTLFKRLIDLFILLESNLLSFIAFMKIKTIHTTDNLLYAPVTINMTGKTTKKRSNTLERNNKMVTVSIIPIYWVFLTKGKIIHFNFK